MIMFMMAIAACTAPALAAERRYSVTDFDRVQVEGPFQVVLKTGKGSSALAIGSSRAIEGLSIEVQGRTLKVRPNRSAWGGYPGEGAGPVTIQLTTRLLRGASVNGSGSLSIDRAEAMRFDLTLTGSGRLTIAALKADSLNVALLGAGAVRIGGSAKTARVTVRGAGDLDGAALAVEDLDLRTETSGVIALAARRSATVHASGAGETVIAGEPACTVTAAGSGPVRCGKD